MLKLCFVMCADNCHLHRWSQAKFRGPVPPDGFARCSMLLLHDMLDSVAQQHVIGVAENSQQREGLGIQQDLGVTDRASSEARWLMTHVGEIYTMYVLLRNLLPLMTQLQTKT